MWKKIHGKRKRTVPGNVLYIKVGNLYDISPVYNAAYSKTSVYLRGKEKAEADLLSLKEKDMEEYYSNIEKSLKYFNVMAKREKVLQKLKDEKKQISARSKAIIEKARGEKRQLNAEENEELGANQCRMAEINLEIAEREEENRQKGRPHQPQGGFSLRRAIANMVDGSQQNDVEAAVIEAATTHHNMSGVQMADRRSIVVPVNVEKRAAFTAATETATGVVIDEEQQEMLLPLQSALVLSRAGAVS